MTYTSRLSAQLFNSPSQRLRSLYLPCSCCVLPRCAVIPEYTKPMNTKQAHDDTSVNLAIIDKTTTHAFRDRTLIRTITEAITSLRVPSARSFPLQFTQYTSPIHACSNQYSLLHSELRLLSSAHAQDSCHHLATSTWCIAMPDNDISIDCIRDLQYVKQISDCNNLLTHVSVLV